MASKGEHMASGMSAVLAKTLGMEVTTGVVAAGTTQLNATALTTEFIEIATASASTGVRLPPSGDASFFVVYNGGANAVLVYPPVGSIMNGASNAGFSVTNAKTGMFFRSGLRYIGVISA